MSIEELETEEEVIKPKKKRRSKKEDANKITGKIDSENFTASVSDIQKDSMVTGEQISEILEESMKQAYLEWSYPGLFKDKESEDPAKELIKAKIVFKDDLSKFSIYDEKTVTEEDDIVDDAYQISLEDAKEIDKKAVLGDVVDVPFDVKLLDKIYVRRVKQLFIAKLKEASRVAVLATYKDRMGGLVEGTVTKADVDNGSYEISFGKAEGFLKKGSRKLLPNEVLAVGERVVCYLESVNENTNPPSLNITRTSPKFVVKLMEREIPEVASGIITVKGIAREAGRRTKIFVESSNPNIDPVGSCIGPESSRQKSISSVLKGEKIEFIKYSTNKAIQVINAMIPAEVIGLTCPEDFFDKDVHYEEFEDDKTYVHPQVTVIVNNGAQGTAIGSEGSNVRLASRLSKCKLTILQIDEAMKNGVKCMMTPEILRIVNGTPNKPLVTPLVPEENLEEVNELVEEVKDEEVQTLDQVNEPKKEEVKETTVVEEIKPVVEEVKEEKVVEEVVTPAVEVKKEEEVVEHVEIKNKPKISLDVLEAALEQKKGSSETKSYKKKDDDVAQVKDNKENTSKVTAMPIYTQEELDAMNQEEESKFESDDEDYEEYDDEYSDYYDEK